MHNSMSDAGDQIEKRVAKQIGENLVGSRALDAFELPVLARPAPTMTSLLLTM